MMVVVRTMRRHRDQRKVSRDEPQAFVHVYMMFLILGRLVSVTQEYRLLYDVRSG